MTAESPIAQLLERLRMASTTAKNFVYTGDSDEVVVPLDIAIEVVGDASARKDDGIRNATEAAKAEEQPDGNTKQPVFPAMEDIAKAIHYPDCWDTVNYPSVYEALYELAGCVGCSECKPAGNNPDAYQKPTKREISFVDALAQAQEVVKAYPLYRKFIDGTPLANDIAVWMAEFAVNGGKP